MNINALKAYVAFLSADQGGGIDYEKSCKNLIGDLNTYEAQLEVTGTKVKDAILGVFEKYKGTIASMASKLAGRNIGLDVDATGADAPAEASAQGRGRPPVDAGKQAALKEQALADTGVQALLEVFPAEIRDVEEM